MKKHKFSCFEKEVLEWLSAGDNPVLAAIREQLAGAEISSRKYTKKGFFLHFSPSSSQNKLHELFPIEKDFAFGSVGIQFDGVDDEGTAILFIRNGKIDCLECVMFTGEWPNKDTGYHFYYYDGNQNIEELQKEWEIKNE